MNTGLDVLETKENLINEDKYYYRQKLRSKEGILSIPNGHEFYSAALKWHISSDDSPEEAREQKRRLLFRKF